MSQTETAQEALYQFIVAYIAEHDRSPTIREIATGCKRSTATVLRYLERLESAGRINRTRYKSRSIRLRGTAPPLDEIAESVYAVIVEAITGEGIAPTQREIAEACHISKSAVQRYLERLEAAERIVRGPGQRDIHLRDQ